MLPELYLDLQEGFSDDIVIVMINGNEMIREKHLTTSLLTGFAKSFKVQVEAGSIDLDASIPSRGINGSIKLIAESKTYIGISILDEQISFIESREPFGYA